MLILVCLAEDRIARKYQLLLKSIVPARIFCLAPFILRLLRGSGLPPGKENIMKFTKSEKYDKEFLKENMMGPNCLKLLEALTEDTELIKSSRVLDLGCGTGITSIFLAKEFGVTVFATDLWISATDNYRRIKAHGLEDSVIPIHAEAHELPYAEEYFDAVISVDSYHYFGRDDEYMDKYLAPLVKKGGLIAVVIPGTIEAYDEVPSELKAFLAPDEFETLRPLDWWKNILLKSRLMRLDSINEFTCDEAWQDWLLCDNEYAVQDRAMFEAGGGKNLNFISFTGRRI